MPRILPAALLALTVVLIPNAAEARHHHRHHVRTHYQVNRFQCAGCFYERREVQRIRYVRNVHTKVSHSRRSRDVKGTGTSELIAKARVYNGMTAGQVGVSRRTAWCAAFLRYIGVKGPVDDRAISFLKLPHTGAQVGAIAVFPHHVGIVTGFHGSRPILISGNSNHRRVHEGPYYRKPIAYVMADSRLPDRSAAIDNER